MTYQVLARKWRPKDFASLVGQEHVVRALTHALDGGRLHHAYLFTGTRGVGKTTLSRIFAKALNCEKGVSSTPCGVCRACREIDAGRFVDYVEMDAASNRGVDEMAALLERAVYAPVDARFKVYMIDEVHMLTNHAFNAMLKTLEEPPAHVKFILATTDPQKIPVTVLSRCLQFNLKQMPAGHIVSHLEHILGEEQVPFEIQALRLLARAADGSMRDALSLTDQAIAYSANQITEDAVCGMLGALDQSYLVRLLDALVAGDGAAVLAVADEMALRSLSFATALQDLASLLHRVAWAQFAPSSVLDEWPEAGDLRRFADALSAEHVQLFYQIATIGRSELGLAPDEYAGFTMTLLRMLAFEPASAIPVNGPRRVTLEGHTPARRDERAAPAVNVQAAQEVQAAQASVSGAGFEKSRPAPSQVAVPVQVAEPSADALAQTDMPGEPASLALKLELDATVVTAASQAGDVNVVPQAAAAVVDEIAPAFAPEEVAVAVIPDTTDSQRNTPVAISAPPEPDHGANAAERPAAPSRPAGGASAALDVLRSAGMKVSADSRASTATAGHAVVKPRAAAPRINVPLPGAARRVAPSGTSTPDKHGREHGAARLSPGAPSESATATPPWDDAPFADYQPFAPDEVFSAAPDDAYLSVSTSKPAAAGKTSSVAPALPVVDLASLPATIALDAIGFAGDWPALAASLPLKGIACQLACNSELTALEGSTLKLSVAVPQYADAAQVAKLKTALAERLARTVEVQVEVGPVHRTAAVIDSVLRAQRQQEAERDIHADPFVQALIREFDARVVQDSIRPVLPAPAPAASGGSLGLSPD
ncbi:DNA polymerase III subunit gamma/tau [Paraburkholderia hayleyella]|uniref:DNA polymerase III subunit gamma/tau n=1 Tax=Paraburkholderia hayleyella TaxID=2152889 RepID=UPI001291200B|nr:DNA polymerase III subunit gamma/tau [Paraburkholderia hayleyella]